MTWSEIKFNIKYRLPMVAVLFSVVITSARLYAGELIAIESIPFLISFVFTAAVGVYLGFVSVGMAAMGKSEHVREIIREREIQVEPDYDYDVDVDSWQDYETEYGIESRKIENQLSPAQALAHIKVNPPESLAECDRLIEKYKNFKTIKLFLLNVRKSLQVESNEIQRSKGDSSGERMIPNSSPQFNFSPKSGAYVGRT